MNITALRARAPSHPALEKYAQIGRLLGRDGRLSSAEAQARLVSILAAWTETLGLPRLGHCGVTLADISRIVANSRGSSMRTNPVELDDREIATILEARI